MKNEVKHTAHSRYRYEYHIVFAPKYRRKVIDKELRRDIGMILRKLCNEMKVEILEAKLCPDHVHLKYKYGSRNFWCRGYYVDTVGKNEKKIREYIRNQLEEDYTKDQISMKEYMDPFTGKKRR